MSDLQRVGGVFGGSGTPVPFTASVSGSQRVNDAHGRYLDAVMGNRVWLLSSAAAAPTAYVGAAGGTPLLAVHNPLSSGKVLALLAIGFGQRAIATVAGQTALAAWAGVSVLPTGTTTAPRSALSYVASGSAGVGFVNAALTSSTALNLVLPVYTHYWATAAAAWSAPSMFLIDGLVVATPGNQIAVGVTVVPTTVTVDVSMLWEEIPNLS